MVPSVHFLVFIIFCQSVPGKNNNYYCTIACLHVLFTKRAQFGEGLDYNIS